jgi:hypothetical protein
MCGFILVSAELYTIYAPDWEVQNAFVCDTMGTDESRKGGIKMTRKIISFGIGIVVVLVLFTGLTLTATQASPLLFHCTKTELTTNNCHSRPILKNTTEAVLDDDDVLEVSETAPIPGHRNRKGSAL